MSDISPYEGAKPLLQVSAVQAYKLKIVQEIGSTTALRCLDVRPLTWPGYVGQFALWAVLFSIALRYPQRNRQPESSRAPVTVSAPCARS